MKSNVLKYGLIAGVALIWGLIIFRIIGGLNNDIPDAVAPAQIPSFNYNAEEDTFSLYANYPDPFLPEEDADTVLTNPLPAVNQPALNGVFIPTEQPVPIITDTFNPAIIKYTGMINNPVKKIKMAILKINEREMVLKEKEKSSDFMLQKIMKDKIIISHKSKKYEIQREQ